MSKKNDDDPKAVPGNPGDDQDFWAQLLAAAHTEAARRLNVTTVQDYFRKGKTLLDTYRIDSDPIEGGMGAVWKVRHLGWDVDLAMKRPKPDLFTDERTKTSFINECQAWIELGLHPNIVSCYYVREIEDVPTIFSEWMENGSLENRIQDGTLYEGNEEEVQSRLLDIAIQYARGLHYAHEKGLIHQDVKPDNVLLTNDWQAKAADFGLAKARAQLTVLDGERTQLDDAGATHMAPSGGYTPAYCSMEQMDGRPLTRRTDIYSWAVSVMEMYYGSRPWSNGVVAGMGCRNFFTDPDSRVPMPERLAELLVKCLETEPDDRPHDFDAVEKELLMIYQQVTGNSYPRTEPKAASDTADSLNNRALSYLDMGQPERAEKCWELALDRDPYHIDARFNRELHLVRSEKKFDYEAVEELRRRKEVCDAGLVEVLAHDNGGSLEPVLIRNELEHYGPAFREPINNRTCSFSESEALFFYSKSKNVQPELFRRDLKTGIELDDDPMEAVCNAAEEIKIDLLQKGWKIYHLDVTHSALLPGTDQMLTVIFAHGWIGKKECHSLYYLCLYDVKKKNIIKGPHLLIDMQGKEKYDPRGDLDNKYAGKVDLYTPLIDKTGRLVIFRFYKRLGPYHISDPKFRNVFTLLVDVPSFQIRIKEDWNFISFLPGSRALFRGRNQQRKMALQVVDEDGMIREVFKFTRAIEKSCETGDGGTPLLCYQYTDGERFYLDENYQKIPITKFPMDHTGSFHPLKFDSEHKLLYMNDERRLGIWDFAHERFCTMPMPAKMPWTGKETGVSFDEASRTLLICDNRYRWAFVRLPVVHPKISQWRLSHIVSSQRRIEEENRLLLLKDRFHDSFTSGDYARAVEIHRRCCEIPGFLGSRDSFEMGTALEAVAEKRKLRSLRYTGDIPQSANFAVFAPHSEKRHNYYTEGIAENYSRLGDGGWALYTSRYPKIGIHIFSPDGTPIRKVTLPSDVEYAAVRNGYIYAFANHLECLLFDTGGKFLRKLCEKDNSIAERESTDIFDLDPGGKYLLFWYMFSERKEQIFQLDISSGTVTKIQTPSDYWFLLEVRSGFFCYLNNETIASGPRKASYNAYTFQSPFNLVERYSVKTGEMISAVTDIFTTYLNPVCRDYVNGTRDRICVHVSYQKQQPDEIRIYDSETNMLCLHRTSGWVDNILQFPEGRFMAYTVRTDSSPDTDLCILDILENEIVFKEVIHDVKDIAFRPDGREIYIYTSVNGPVKVFQLEYDYQIK